jgi:hypothetical protein
MGPHRLWDEMRQNQTQHRNKRNAVARLFVHLVGAGEQRRGQGQGEWVVKWTDLVKISGARAE